MEYSPGEGRVDFTVSYGGERFDPAGGENELSYRVLKKSVDELTYEYDPGAEYGNTVRVVFREKDVL